MAEQESQIEWVLMLGMVLFVIGFTLILLGSLLSAGANLSAGGVVIIGPIPILLGSGPYGQILALISALIALLVVALYLLWFFRRRSVVQ